MIVCFRTSLLAIRYWQTPYTIVTFPFLFAVMFGDAGHGLLLLMLALYFIYNEKKLGADKLNDMIQMPFDGRYVLFLMSVFAIYCGFLYNEFFGMPLDIWGGTRWHYGSSEAAVTGANGMGTMAGGYKECSTIGATTPSGATTLSDGPTYWDHTKKYTDFAATKFVDSEDPDRYNPDGNYPDWADVFDDKTMLPGCTLPPKVRAYSSAVFCHLSESHLPFSLFSQLPLPTSVRFLLVAAL
eukprot:SAG31_NODE_379_length_16485_cov_3.654583_6_plen_240_part_00